MKKLPAKLWVSWCATCGIPIGAGRTQREARVIGCLCGFGKDDVRLVRVAVVPPKRRRDP